MNYLSHYVFNHDVCGLPREPWFAIGVVLPDLWVRFSRRRRIRWKLLRAAEPADDAERLLRAGLLNHVEADRRFHVLGVFLRWQRALKGPAVAAWPDVHPALVDFVAHAGIELVMDHLLLRERPELADEFYGCITDCDPALVAARAGRLGHVDTDGLAEVIAGFCRRRFLTRYTALEHLVEVIHVVLTLAKLPTPPGELSREVLWRAVEIVDVGEVFRELEIAT
jgi:hypothetical protein